MGILFSPYELASNSLKIILSDIGIVGFDDSRRTIVVFRRAFVLRFGSTTFDTTIKALKVLHRGIWQSWIDGCVPSWGHEDDGLVLLWEGAVLTTPSSWGVTGTEE